MTEVNPHPKAKRRKLAIYLVNILLLATIAAGIYWAVKRYTGTETNLYTNDAQVEQYLNPVNTRIQGYILEVRFNEFQRVKKGDTLVIIDDREYAIQVLQAEAALLQATASREVSTSSVSTVSSNIQVVDANIRSAEAQLLNAEQNYRRFRNLLDDGAATQQQFDQVSAEYHSLLAQTEALQRQRTTTGLSAQETYKRVFVNEAEIKRSQAALDYARLNLSYTVIVAPYDGVAGRRIIQEGQLVQPGQQLLTFARDDEKWVVANYKETLMPGLYIGREMAMRVDALDGKRIKGRITAISEATGSKYSAVPVDNSTGNFVKVQQRIPVRIDFMHDSSSRDVFNLLKAGMNVEVRIAD
ncbi:MAG: HlyD family secretion protein [Chitinophagaceae bacterium]